METEEKNEKSSILKDFYKSNKILVWILIVVLVFLLITNVLTKKQNNEEIGKEEVMVNISSSVLELSKNTSETLTFSVSNNKNAIIKWESSNSNVATVSSTGLVHGINSGTAIITGIYFDEETNTTYKKQCSVTVYEGDKSISLTKVSFPDGDLMMRPGQNFTLSLNIMPSRAYIETIEYTSSDVSIANVSENGKVTALKEGMAIIHVSVNNGDFEDDITVYVVNKNINANIILNPERLMFDSKYEKMMVNDTYRVPYSFEPMEASLNEITWSSSDTSILEVSSTGRIKALKEGTAKIRIEALNGEYDEMTIEVVKNIVEVSKISLEKYEIEMKVGEQYNLVPQVLPNDASNKALQFISSDMSVVSVNPNMAGTQAVVLAYKEGNAIITVKSIDGKVAATLKVKVVKNEESTDIPKEDENKPISRNTSVNLNSDQNNIVYNYNDALNIKASAPSTFTFKLGDGLSKVKYCVALATLERCKPYEEAYNGTQYTVVTSGVYRIRMIKYDLEGNEIIGTTSNYIEGALECYISTLQDKNQSVQRGYTISSNVYDSLDKAIKNSYTQDQNITMKITGSNTKYLKICRKQGTSCGANDTLTTWNNNSILPIKGKGNWYLTVVEFDANNKELRRDTWYVVIK